MTDQQGCRVFSGARPIPTRVPGSKSMNIDAIDDHAYAMRWYSHALDEEHAEVIRYRDDVVRAP